MALLSMRREFQRSLTSPRESCAIRAMRQKPIQTTLLLAALALVAGCGALSLPDWNADEASANEEAFFTDAGVAEEENLGLLAKLRRLRESHVQDPADIETALAYSRGLRRIGSARRALEVMEASGAQHPDDARVQEELAKVLLANGDHRRALEILDSLPPSATQDWRTLSAHGVALDHAGRHEEAQEKYRLALEQETNHPAILTNLGLSHILSGDPETAETHLRLALGDARADARTRQNLALALGLRGRFAEAEQLAARDLPPAAIQNNLAWLHALTAEPAEPDENGNENEAEQAAAPASTENTGATDLESETTPAVARLASQQEGIFFLSASEAETLWRQRRQVSGFAESTESTANTEISETIETPETIGKVTAPVPLPEFSVPLAPAAPIPVFPLSDGSASP